ncbi:uncharacterized protein UV8b_03578 [Ustilaginoidea virens]|uniref:BZIP domain-containing protein n=1 Tax=Ustilaginoidea virens TaxID=1159556 RepID=A0A8E5MGW2_USTVR|nr:uncharacterized protein UV8b_03578 [Ustilaginoidea virens]QUC19337.1 hypothetical protein UV8b_03578 [Ustilaginoidea virens]
MSQRDPATRPSSRRSSTSPLVSTGPRLPESCVGSHDDAAAAGSIKTEPSNTPAQVQQLPPKALGMLNILNPPDARAMGSQGARQSSKQLGYFPTSYSMSATYGPSKHGGLGHSSSASYPGTPIGNAGFPSVRSERSSLSMSHPSAFLDEPRKVLSPKIPRPASLGSGSSSLSRDMDSRARGYTTTTSPAKRPYEPDVPDEPRQLTNLHQAARMAHVTGARASTPPQGSLSEPVARNSDVSLPSTQPGLVREIPGLPPHAHGHLQHSPPPVPLPTGARLPEGTSPWAEVMRRSGIAGSGGIEGQQAFMTLPGSDIPIPVQVDYSQASKKADEKRQRNAKASTRHRRKKKTIQEENVRQLQDLKEERQQVADELEQMRQQRDFYRDERNRLRDIVSRTPGIHHHAAGPPSPTPTTRSAESHTERSPTAQQLASTPVPGYSGECPSVDRPVQRSGVEGRAEYMGPGFVPGAAPGALPSPLGQPYGAGQDKVMNEIPGRGSGDPCPQGKLRRDGQLCLERRERVSKVTAKHILGSFDPQGCYA